MPQVPNCFYRVSTKALIMDDNKKFLLTLEKKGVWELPGGGLDFGEKPREGLKREIQEETGLEVVSIEETPDYFVTASYGENWKANVIYKTTVKNLDFKPSDECIELRFFTKEEALKEKLYPGVKEFIEVFNPYNH